MRSRSGTGLLSAGDGGAGRPVGGSAVAGGPSRWTSEAARGGVELDRGQGRPAVAERGAVARAAADRAAAAEAAAQRRAARRSAPLSARDARAAARPAGRRSRGRSAARGRPGPPRAPGSGWCAAARRRGRAARSRGPPGKTSAVTAAHSAPSTPTSVIARRPDRAAAERQDLRGLREVAGLVQHARARARARARRAPRRRRRGGGCSAARRARGRVTPILPTIPYSVSVRTTCPSPWSTLAARAWRRAGARASPSSASPPGRRPARPAPPPSSTRRGRARRAAPAPRCAR